MPTIELPQLVPTPTRNPSIESRIGDLPKPTETIASKKVDDLSRHESKHDMAPKHDHKLNPREKGYDGAKPGCCQPKGSQPAPGHVKK